MKLVICKECKDVIAPVFYQTRECQCRGVKTWYVNEARIVVRGEGKVIAIENSEIIKALDGAGGETLSCWVLPDQHQQVTHQPFGFDPFKS